MFTTKVFFPLKLLDLFLNAHQILITVNYREPSGIYLNYSVSIVFLKSTKHVMIYDYNG